MRGLGFRAWSVKKRKFLNIDTLYCSNGKVCAVVDDGVVYDVEDVILEQYTGLKDKNGKEIHVGDIVRIMGYGTYEVFWRSWDSSFSLKAIDTDIEEHQILMLCNDWEGDYTLIGNIHENPELLEEKE